MARDKVIFGLVGAGGFAREVMPLVRQAITSLPGCTMPSQYEVCFVETNPKKHLVNGLKVISEEEFSAMVGVQRFFNVAIADSKVREFLAERLIQSGAKSLALQAQNAIVYDENRIGDGAILCDFSTITSNTVIGKFFHSNIYSYVAHDCVIGDYVTFAPRVSCNGNVHIGNHAYIGTGVVIKQGSLDKPLHIGEGAVVGMGAVVTKDVLPYTTVVGNPARIYKK